MVDLPNNKTSHMILIWASRMFEDPLKSAECKCLKGGLRLPVLQAVVALETPRVHAASLPRRGRGRREREIGREEQRRAQKLIMQLLLLAQSISPHIYSTASENNINAPPPASALYGYFKNA